MFKVCYSELYRGLKSYNAEDLIADFYGNDLLTQAERDQLYDAPDGQRTRLLMNTLEKHISAEPKYFNTLLQVLESDERHCPLFERLKDKMSRQK